MVYWTLFFTFVKIGLFTIGGGYAMIPLIEREVVRRKWLEEVEFLDLLAVTQSLPGIFAVNISIFVGHRLRGLRGGLLCALGTILPSFVIILLIAFFFNRYEEEEWVVRVFNGIRPAVVALIVVPCLSAAKAMRLSRMELVFPLLGALLIWQAGVSPVYVVVAGIVGGLVYSFWIKGRFKKEGR
ncbi:MAG: chromate transporter [Odoribacter sp.]